MIAYICIYFEPRCQFLTLTPSATFYYVYYDYVIGFYFLFIFLFRIYFLQLSYTAEVTFSNVTSLKPYFTHFKRFNNASGALRFLADWPPHSLLKSQPRFFCSGRKENTEKTIFSICSQQPWRFVPLRRASNKVNWLQPTVATTQQREVRWRAWKGFEKDSRASSIYLTIV